MLFFWIVNLYQSLVATTTCFGLLMLSSAVDWLNFRDIFGNDKFLFIHIIFLVNVAMAITEYHLPKGKYSYNTFKNIEKEVFNSQGLFKFLGALFFVFGTFFFIRYATVDYHQYNAIVYKDKWIIRLVAVSCCSIMYFAAKKKYLTVAYFLFIFGVVTINSTVRQVFFIPLLPLAVLYLSYFWKKNYLFKTFAVFLVPAFCAILLFGLFMNSSKFSDATMLPDAELTPMAINTLGYYDFERDGYLTFTSVESFIWGLTAPLQIPLKYIGITFDPPLSLPHMTAALMRGDTSLDSTVGEWHCPATIYLDFYVSWGWYFPIAVIIVYYLLTKGFSYINRSGILTVLFSYQLMNFIYFFIRGAVDTAAGTLAFPALYLFIIATVYKGNIKYLYK
ncbi:MAG: hypothetical protein PHX08_03915 [Lachnospiraceae bacterium]|nr:hypothetical protein [Lachnospiraceae bacterium]